MSPGPWNDMKAVKPQNDGKPRLLMARLHPDAETINPVVGVWVDLEQQWRLHDGGFVILTINEGSRTIHLSVFPQRVNAGRQAI